MVIGLPDRLSSTEAPASAASALGGTGTHMSSQISTWILRSGRSAARNSRSVPNGASWAPTTMVSTLAPVRSSPGANQRRS